MKVMICTQKFIPPFIGGVDVYTDRLAQALRRLGHEVKIIAFDPSLQTQDNSFQVTSDNYDNFQIWRLKFAFSQRPKKAFDLLYDQQVGQVVKNILEQERPEMLIMINFYMITLAPVEVAKDLDIFVAHVTTDFLPVCRRGTFMRWDNQSCETGESIQSCATCFISHRTLGRYAAYFLNKLPESTIEQWAIQLQTNSLSSPALLFKPYLNHAAIMVERLKILEPLRKKIDLVLTPNRFIMNAFLNNGFEPEQVKFLPFGVEPDHPLSKVVHTPTSYTRFLFVGRLQPYKGGHLLIDAFNKLASPKDATLTIYGVPDGHDNYFEQLQASMALNKRIHFAGKIDPKNLGTAFAEADFFVLPSTWHENSPLILLDALQSKTPVIASNIGGVTDVVKHEKNGLLFPVGDIEALKQTMQRVIDDTSLSNQLRAGIDLLTIDNYAQSIIDFYNDHRESKMLEASKRLA